MDLTTDQAIDALDFAAIKSKLVNRKSGKGWTPERADAAEREYRRFLYLIKKYPNELAAPSVEVDTFWHQHILDTAQYARDCEVVFGHFLHHYPYLGLSAEGEDVTMRHRAGQRMRELYEATFGFSADRALGNTATGYCVVASTAYCVVSKPSPASPRAAVPGNDVAYCVSGPSLISTANEGETAYCVVSSVLADASKNNGARHAQAVS